MEVHWKTSGVCSLDVRFNEWLDLKNWDSDGKQQAIGGDVVFFKMGEYGELW